MTCLKTGCNIAFTENPDYVYRGDMHIFESDVVIFKVRTPTYSPTAKVDFFIMGDEALVVNDVLVTRPAQVEVCSNEVHAMWSKYTPSLLNLFKWNI